MPRILRPRSHCSINPPVEEVPHLSSYVLGVLCTRLLALHTRTMMFESSLILEMAVLLKVTVFSFGLIFLLAFLTGNLVLLIINLWIVYLCALVCGALGLVAVRSLCVSMPSIWPNMDDIEAAQLFHETALSSFEPHNVESEPMGCSITYGLKDNLVCSSPLEMLNKLTAEIDILDDHEIEATFTTVAEGPKDYYTPFMSPFASPPRTSWRSSFAEKKLPYMKMSPPIPMVHDHLLPLIETCATCLARVLPR
ncbi:hypothetical protein RHS01_06305 [Rhizoctonia solani]|uniref:Uncharacterized protein n=1 Tax=Rhizoctonia solani TaxID=456999 RepID=A0A8H7IDC5_9AGAM|nr:hypothetical protein RHS01_06305 [Rhizoctonia solani]